MKEQYVKISVKELEALCRHATDALDCFAEDYAVDALFYLHERLKEMIEEPDRRIDG